MAETAVGGPLHVALGYGRGSVTLTGEPGRFDLLAPADATARELSDAELLARLQAPIGSPPLEQLVSARERVCLVVPDATRACGSQRLVQLVLQRLRGLGIADGRIEILIGAGAHRAPTAEEVVSIVGGEAVRRVAVVAHDAHDLAAQVLLGRTARGTPVELDRRLVTADRVIVCGAIGLHYFAGFSGGRKGILPGCASDRAIQTNHLLAFDLATLSRTAGVASGRLDGNPVSEDMEEATALHAPTFLVNSVVGAGNRIVELYTGHWRAAHRQGCAEYLERHAVPVAGPRDLVVVSCGGAPRDVDMIQSHKALEHARVVLNDGGDLVLLAECADGLGRPDFLNWFVPGGADATAKLLVKGYKVNGQTAWGIRWKAERYRVRLVSALPADSVRRMGMIPHTSLDEALAASNPGRGYVIPNGLGTLPVLGDAPAPAAGREGRGA